MPYKYISIYIYICIFVYIPPDVQSQGIRQQQWVETKRHET